MALHTGPSARFPIDHLAAEHFSPLGASPIVLLDLGDTGAEAEAKAVKAGASPAVVVGLDWAGKRPEVDPDGFDVLLTSDINAPAPWVGLSIARCETQAWSLWQAVEKTPHAATLLCQVVRMVQGLSVRDGLAVESLAYSTLLSGAEFHHWRQNRPLKTGPAPSGPCVTIARDNERVTISLARPNARNAMSAGMRDALFEALAAVADDPTRPQIDLVAEGPCFSVGGELGEFGTARDLAQAHSIRTVRSCAALLLELESRTRAIVNGACIGSGVEIAAAAATRIGHASAFFQLPELRMGLIPGAGGTVTLPRLIGRHRFSYMVLSGCRLGAATALRWGLLTGIVP